MKTKLIVYSSRDSRLSYENLREKIGCCDYHAAIDGSSLSVVITPKSPDEIYQSLKSGVTVFG